MTQLYLRNINIEVSTTADVVKIPNDFKIAISVKKLISAKSAIGTVQIFNLSDATKEKLRAANQRIKIFAGYRDSVGLIHDGDILRTTQIDDGANRITVLFLAGRVFSTNTAIFSKGYKEPTSLRTIVGEAIKTFGLPFNDAELNKIPSNLLEPAFVFNGPTQDVLNTLLNPLSIQWHENNSQIRLSKVGEASLESETAVDVLNSNTGLIKTALQTDRGVNAVALLNPRLQVGRIVEIESDVIQNSSFPIFNNVKKSTNTKGLYKIIQVTYQGDNWDGKFECLLQCVPYSVFKKAS